MPASAMVLYGSVSRPEDDVSVSGGVIDVTHRPIWYELSWPSLIQIVSTSDLDFRSVTITGRDLTGNAASEVITAQGLGTGNGTIEFIHIDKVEASATHATATIYVVQQLGALMIHDINPGELGGFRMFLNANSSTVDPKSRYEKLFWKNTDDSDVPTLATVQLSHDAIGKITIGLEAVVDGTQSVATRLLAPAGVAFVDDDVAISVPGGTLAAGSAIGVWIKQTLSANDGPYDAFLGLKFCGDFPENNATCCPDIPVNLCLFNCGPGFGTSFPDCIPPPPPPPPIECSEPCPVGKLASAIYDGAVIVGGPAINVNELSTPDANFLVTAIYFPSLHLISLVWYNGESNTELGTVLGSVSHTLAIGEELRVSTGVRIAGVIQFSVSVDGVAVVGPVGDEDIPEDAPCVTFFTLIEPNIVDEPILRGAEPILRGGEPLVRRRLG